MRFLPLLTAVVVVVISACTSSDPAPAAKPTADGGVDAQQVVDAGKELPPSLVNVTTETIAVEGVSREYLLAVPKTFDVERAYPLVLVFHGDGEDGARMRELYTFDAASGAEAIVAYPTGSDRTWNVQAPSATNRDIKLVDALVTALSSKFLIDRDRIFGTGFGSGAVLVNKIACRKTGFFRAIVSHAGGAPVENEDPESGIWPSGLTKCFGQDGGVAAMIVHGEDDDQVSPDDGDFNATYWGSINGCQESRVDSTPSPCQKYEGCPVDKPALWCLVPGLGHAVWEHGAKEGWAFMKGL
ncbi:MAG TPA: hypothetical protein VM925_11025 [Labilithrix sp.]|nr:hypothetical protein [Labilithrix sp.]